MGIYSELVLFKKMTLLFLFTLPVSCIRLGDACIGCNSFVLMFFFSSVRLAMVVQA